MSQELKEKPNNNEEIDLLILFNFIGDRINNFFRGIGKIFIAIFSVIIFTAKEIFSNIKLISFIVIIAGILGYVLESSKPSRYESKMLVRTYFEAKYQLATNINYYNALLQDGDYKSLSSIFELSEESMADVVRFEMISGPETENDRIVQYDRFVRSIDSIRAQDISFDDFIENRDIYSGSLFEIRVESRKKDIFQSLELGLNSSFVNLYSTKKMAKRDSMISIKKENILTTLQEIDSLKKVYINVIENESKSPQTSLSLGDFPMKQEKSQTKEYQLLDKQISLRNELRQLDEQKIDESVFFDVISSFQSVGNRVSLLRERYSLIFPFLAFAILCLGYATRRFIFYVNKYEF